MSTTEQRKGRRSESRALLRVLGYVSIAASLAAACVPGLDDERYGPPSPPPSRPDTLPTAYASVAAFCVSPADPTGEPLPTMDSARPVPRGPDDRVPGVKDMWFAVPLRCVVRDPSQLRALWKFTRDTATAPEVDFGERMLLVATAGERGVTGFALSINDVWQRSDTLIVTVGEYLVGNGCMSTAEVVNPADALRVPRVAAVRFHETIISGDTCL